jgi:DNA-binding Lrp family transcriptional regulator
MANLPKEIAECLKRLRKEHAHYVAVKVIKGRHYAFEVMGRWNKERKKNATITNYLGRISPNGTFMPAHHRNCPPLSSEIRQQTNPEPEPGKYDGIVLRNLSMNGRMPIDMLAKRMGVSLTSARYHISKIEERYGLRYFADVDIEKLGYLGYFIFVKFRDSMPTAEEIRGIVDDEPHIQLAIMTSGRYDLVLYILAKSHRDVVYFLYELRSKSALNKYQSLWYTTPQYSRSYTIPLRDPFFRLLEDRIWHRTRERPRPESSDITEREYNVMRELCMNGAIDFARIDGKYGYGKGSSRYAYSKLRQRGIIRRMTITISRPPIKYTAMLFVDFANMVSFDKTRQNLLFETIADGKLMNKYAFAVDIGTPQGYLMVMPVFIEGELALTEGHLMKMIKGVRLRRLIVTENVVGSFCYRNFDPAYTNQYRLLVEEYKLIKPQISTSYEERQV